MKKLVKGKELQNMGVPLLNLLNIYKLEREKVYERHKLSKKERKEVRA